MLDIIILRLQSIIDFNYQIYHSVRTVKHILDEYKITKTVTDLSDMTKVSILFLASNILSHTVH